MGSKLVISSSSNNYIFLKTHSVTTLQTPKTFWSEKNKITTLLFKSHTELNTFLSRTYSRFINMAYHHKHTHSHRHIHTRARTHTHTHTHTFLSQTYSRFISMSHHHKLTHIDKHTHTHSHTHSRTHTHAHTHTHWRTHTHRDMYKKAWLCSAEEFLELYGNIEAVVSNCLLRWSGHLFEVPSTHLFDQCFCFKHISLFIHR